MKRLVNCRKWPRQSTMASALSIVCMCMASNAGAQAVAAADSPEQGSNFKLSGYIRTWASINLQDVPETKENDKGDLSMLRSALSLNADLKTGPIQWKAIARVDREYKTNYLRRLEKINQATLPGGPGSDILSLYNQAEIRELYADFSPVERVHLRVGRQQVVWGETDFFHVTDLIHGFDLRWRSFLEKDNDELRKPLNLINAMIDVPEASGNLQIIVRPGLDRNRDIGTTYDLSGGRWALQPNKGVDFLSPLALTNNYSHPDANTKDVTGGLRWSGQAGGFNYGLSYLKTYSANPIVNSSFVPFEQKPVGTLGDFIHPKINVVGASVSKDIAALDAVFSAETAFIRDSPYNVGTNFFGGQLPGFGGIKKKDAWVTSVRFDKSLRLMELIGTVAPSFSSIQVFDTFIQDYDKADDLVELVGFGAPVRRHTTILSGFITLNYLNNRLNPGLAFGADLTNGDAFLIPSVDFSIGNNWRLLLEADIFMPNNQKRPGEVEIKAHPLGGFAHNNQLVARVTYQF